MISEFEWHLRERGLSQYHRCWHTGPLPENPKEEHVVFPLVMPGGKYIGHQRYFWRRTEQGRYITTILPAYKNLAFYGYDNCFGFSPLFVTEGVWDSIRIGNCYVDSVAILTNKPSKQLRQYLYFLANGRPVYAMLDKDDAGDKMRVFDRWFKPPYHYKDWNEVPHDDCFQYITKILEEEI